MVDKDKYLGNDTYLISNLNQDENVNLVGYQALHEDLDDIFREKIYASAGCVDDEEEVHQSEANKFFTPTRKRKQTEINDQLENMEISSPWKPSNRERESTHYHITDG